MKVYLYSGMQKMIEKSGVGRAIYHQKEAAKQIHIGLADGLQDADIVHINTVFPMSFYLAKKARKMKIPVIYHAHSTKEDFRDSYIGSNVLDYLFGKWITCCYSQGTMIVTPSAYSRQRLLSYGIHKKIAVVSNGVDLDFYNAEKTNAQAFRKEYGYQKTDKVIMCVGLPIERKGLSDFIELAKRMPRYQFIWFGDVNRHTVPVKTRHLLQTRLPNLKFAGYVKPEKLREAYRGCDLFLFPSKEETEGIVVLEALAMKIPILIRDIPVYKDWLIGGREVYKAETIDDFERKIKNIVEKNYPDLTENGYRVVQKRSMTQIGKELEHIYKLCLGME